MKRWFLGFVFALSVGLSVSERASAFCRTTSANPSGPEPVVIDEEGCILSGTPLAWDTTCIPIGVHEAGSPKRGISFAEAHEIASQAWSVWEQAECEDGALQLAFVDRGKMFCDELQFLKEAQVSNNNVVIFRDDWPYGTGSSQLALTTLTFSTATGEILDADVEINSDDIDFGQGVDLKTALVHEFGHVLGLAHVVDPDSVMNRDVDRSEARTTLASDDAAGVCAIAGAGPDAVSCKAQKVDVDYTRECAELAEVQSSCSLGPRPAPSLDWVWFGMVLAALGVRRRRSVRA